MLSGNLPKGTVAIYRKNVDGLSSPIVPFECVALAYHKMIIVFYR
jgi:hypothetical protein